MFGRDAGADVVVAGNDVSRRHAEIQPSPEGYVLMDVSVNGTYVNGERVGRRYLLSRADVIRIGHDEFRFYADAAPPPGFARRAVRPWQRQCGHRREPALGSPIPCMGSRKRSSRRP